MLPERFAAWFARRGWAPRAHQLELLAEVQKGRSALLIAPTGGGKTLAGFLPSLIELSRAPHPGPLPGKGEREKRAAALLPSFPFSRARGLHTLYISPLKALAVDVARNVGIPIQEMELSLRLETRSGDSSQYKRQRQRTDPPDILFTTPEQLALLLAHPTASTLFGGLRYVVLDELHVLAPSKRGDLLALGLARLSRLAPNVRRIGLSATVANPERLRRFLVPQNRTDDLAALVTGAAGAQPEISVMMSEAEIPWAGHMARHALGEVLSAIRANGVSLVFVNTRAQAEFVFQQLWRMNDDGLPIALHHGSLSPEQRRKVEAAMAKGSLRAVVCTSTLDLGIDWGAVDLVIHVGAPKGASRLIQRIGRANHRLDEPSRAVLVPSNRFEVLECEAARMAALAGTLDPELPRTGGLDVLAQHVLGTACASPFLPDALYDEVASAAPYAALPREDFDKVVEFVATGGYALKSYDRYRKLVMEEDGRYRLAHPRLAQEYRMNAGTIVEEPMVKVKLLKHSPRPKVPPRGGFTLGEIEEYFIEQMSRGDTFLFAGHVLRFEMLVETDALTTRTSAESPMIPSYNGGKFPLSTHLAERVRAMLADPASAPGLPLQVRDWLSLQRQRSKLPQPNELLVETFPRGARFYLVCYPFEGRLAHQTLGMLLTRRLERARMRPMGFVANDYALAVWGLRDMGLLNMGELFSADMLGDDLESWLVESALLKRTFRACATIAGLIPKRMPGGEKTGRQMTVSSDLIYDVLRGHEPDHILLKATYADASAGLLDVARVSGLLQRIAGRIVLQRLSRISPLAVPIMLEIGREPVYGEASEVLLAEAAQNLAAEALEETEGAA
jgi:ATP-dependent Lhr-like helicase